MKQFTGWLLDLYPHPKNGVVLWLLCDDGKRQFFFQDFATAFYVRGPFPRLRELWRFLLSKPVRLEKVERDNLYEGTQQVMQVQVASPNLHAGIFREAQNAFPDLIYYDVDIALSLRYAAVFNVFPMARCQITMEQNKVEKIIALDSPWDIDPLQAPLRELTVKPNVDPSHAVPEYLLIKYGKFKFRAPLDKPRDLLFLLNSILRSYNPDVIITQYGDTWLFKYLEELSKQTNIPFQPNRDFLQGVIKKKAISFFNYGRAHYRGEQVHLLGRWHIDVMNCSSYSEYGLSGVMEESRITCLPVQEAARRSAGAGISAMQVLTALRRGVLVPYQRQKGEASKTYNQLFKMDRGGLIFEPLLGVFKNVAILDFMMMYPSIMVAFNLSPETVGVTEADAWEIPGIGIKISNRRGLIPETLEPMVNKRITIKRRLKNMPQEHADFGRYRSCSAVMKNLGIVSNGRMGYANSIFGRITAYETISYLSRKIILQAKAIAEDHGFTVLHIYVDSLFLCREDATTPADFKAVMDEIEDVTKLPINLEDVYPWMAFVSSRRSAKIPVANRFFGSRSDGSFKVRGLVQRRRDTCPFVAELQKEVLNILAQEPDPAKLILLLPAVIDMTKEKCRALQNREIPIKQLVVTRTLSRELHEYRASSALLDAATQLAATGRIMHMGEQVRYIHILGKPRSYPWDLPTPLRQEMINVRYYTKLVLRAIYEVVQPLGVTFKMLKDWISGASYVLPSDLIGLSPKEQIALELPLFANHLV